MIQDNKDHVNFFGKILFVADGRAKKRDAQVAMPLKMKVCTFYRLANQF